MGPESQGFDRISTLPVSVVCDLWTLPSLGDGRKTVINIGTNQPMISMKPR